MPITSDERLLDALQDMQFTASIPSGGLACPVCFALIADEGGSDGMCDHLLAHGVDSAEDMRNCWAERRPHHFVAQLAREPEDRFLLREDWVPVETHQCDRGGCAWVGWFAFPSSMLSASETPEEAVRAQLRRMEGHLESLGEVEVEEDEDE